MTVGNHTLPTDIMDSCNDGFLYCFADWAKSVTNGAFWIFSLFAFCIAIYFSTMRFGNTKAFGFASFVGLLGGVWFAILNLISWWIASIFIIIGAIGIAAMIMSK